MTTYNRNLLNILSY